MLSSAFYSSVTLHFGKVTSVWVFAGEYYGDISMEKKKIDQHFQKLKQEQMRHLLDALNVQERLRIDQMIDKHAHEMLQLIDKKVDMLV